MRPLEVGSLGFLLDALHFWPTLSSMCFIAVESTIAILVGRSLSTFFTLKHVTIPFGGNSLKDRVHGLIEPLPAASLDLLLACKITTPQ